MNKYFILGIICLIFSVSGLLYVESQSQTEKGDCYDNRDNKIDELTCDVRVSNNPYIAGIALISMLASVILFFIGIMDECN